MSAVEVSRPVAVAKAADGFEMVVTPDAAERAALALRMGLVSLDDFSCSFRLRRGDGATIEATGALRARVVQTCVISNEPFPAEIGEDFEVRFVPAGSESEELDLEAIDEVPYEGTVIDLGEAASEQLGLALDPFPRKPGVEMPADYADDVGNAFLALKGLK